MLFAIRQCGGVDPRRLIRSMPLAEIRRLALVVAKDYERRANGIAPDRWHWADAILFFEGYYLQDVTGDAHREPSGLVGSHHAKH